MQDFVQLPSFNAVAAGSTATLSVPLTATYRAIWLQYAESGVLANQATMEAAIAEIRVKLNGRIQRRMTGADLIMLNAFNSLPFTAGFLPIVFAERQRRTADAEDALGWGTLDLQTFQVEVDIASGATAPTLAAYAEIGPANREMGTRGIVKVFSHHFPVGATGVNNLVTLPKQDAYLALHCKSADIDDFEVRVDNRERRKSTVALNNVWLKEKGFVPQTDVVHIKFDLSQRIGDVLPTMRADGRMVQDFRVDFNMSAASSFTIVAETIGRRT